MVAVCHCRSCGQRFDAEDNPVGNPLGKLCAPNHVGPFYPIQNQQGKHHQFIFPVYFYLVCSHVVNLCCSLRLFSSGSAVQQFPTSTGKFDLIVPSVSSVVFLPCSFDNAHSFCSCHWLGLPACPPSTATASSCPRWYYYIIRFFTHCKKF